MAENWKAAIRLGVEELVDRAVVAGAHQQDVFSAIEDELSRLRIALERHPDPEDDTTPVRLDEPANEWPGEEK